MTSVVLWMATMTMAQSNWTAHDIPVLYDVPTTASVRQWGPTGDFFIMHDVRDTALLGQPGAGEHSLLLYHGQCGGADCLTQTQMADRAMDWFGSNLDDNNYNASMAISAVPAFLGGTGLPRIDVVYRSKVTLDCDGDGINWRAPGALPVEASTLGLRGSQYRASTNLVSSFAVIAQSVSGTCIDRGRSYTRYRKNEVWSCWRDKDTPTNKWLTCGHGNGDLGLPFANTELVRGPTVDLEHHVSFDWLGRPPGTPFTGINTDRSVVHRSIDIGGNETIRMRYVDNPSDPWVSVSGPPGPGFRDYPSVNVNGDVSRVVWESGPVAGGLANAVSYADCDRSLVDCQQDQLSGPSTWSGVQTVATGLDVNDASIIVSGQFQAVVYTSKEDILLIDELAPGVPDNRVRVMYTERCGDGAWSTPEMVLDSSVNAAFDDYQWQSLALGAPSVAINSLDHLVHVAFVDSNKEKAKLSTSGKLWHAVRPYTTCN